MAAKPERKSSPIQLTVQTSEVQEVKSEGILYYILPPMVVAAVFLYCAVSTPDLPPAATTAPAAAPVENIDLDEFSDEELDGDEESEPEE